MIRQPVNAYRDEETGGILLVYRKSGIPGWWKPIPTPDQIRDAIRRLLDLERMATR